MKDFSLVLDAVSLSEYAHYGEPSALDQILETLQTLGPFRRILVCTDNPRMESLLASRNLEGEILFHESWSLEQYLERLGQALRPEEQVIRIQGDMPFTDPELTRRMAERFEGFFADYCFADGYPAGLSPEILKASLIPLLAEFQGKKPVPWTRDCLFALIQQDINAFDIETEMAPSDYRMMRITLAADSKRNWLRLQRLKAALPESCNPGISPILEALEARPDLHRTLPSYVQIQLTARCPQSCSYCPYPQINPDHRRDSRELDPSEWKNWLDQIEELSDDAVISVSPWGEPALHSEFPRLVDILLDHPGLSLLVETAGLGWDRAYLRELSRRREAQDRITWIVSLDSMDPGEYARLRGEGFQEAVGLAEELLALFPEKAYVQAVRMADTEDNLEAFYRHWKEKTDNIIIQKYDTLAGELSDRRVTDLSPLSRIPCWHLMRDAVILLDGTVSPCREAPEGGLAWGNIREISFKELWERGNDLFREHFEGRYPGICGSCDEYYTYNF